LLPRHFGQVVEEIGRGCAYDEVELGGFDFDVKSVGTAGLAIRLGVVVCGHCPNSLFAIGMHERSEFIRGYIHRVVFEWSWGFSFLSWHHHTALVLTQRVDHG